MASWRSVRLTVELMSGCEAAAVIVGSGRKTTVVEESDTSGPAPGLPGPSHRSLTASKCLADGLLRPAPARCPQAPGDWTATICVAIVSAARRENHVSLGDLMKYRQLRYREI